MSDKKLTVSLFSAGVSSAVATKLAIKDIDLIIYTHIDDHHYDTMRFVKECEAWFGKPVQILQSRYKNVENACLGAGGYIKGHKGGSPCTRLLKIRVRKEWEIEHLEHGVDLTYIWGMDCKETDRAEKLKRAMPNMNHRFPLIEQSKSKEHVHEIMKASGIKRPMMYDLGYHNNNCIGCVKGGMGYWNKIRVDFPDVFLSRAKLERRTGASILKTCPPKGQKSELIWLDELDPERGRHAGPICDDCGIMCEIMAI